MVAGPLLAQQRTLLSLSSPLEVKMPSLPPGSVELMIAQPPGSAM
jgi:hypothetical protein